MKLGSLFVKRPVMTSMVFMGVALFGILSWTQLPQELFPNISVPQLVVITKYPNAAPEEIENLITKPMEEAVGTVPNLKRITSISKEGVSAVTLYFGWGTDMGFAHLSTREKLDRMKDRLPQEAEEPIIKRVNPFAHPVLIISVTGDMELAEMTDLCNDIIKKKLEKADGVAAVTISGGQKREILVEVDRGRLDASAISLPMVVDALKNANYDYPAGTTQGKVVEYLVRTHGRFTHLNDIGQTIVQVENPDIDPVYKWTRREEKSHTSAPREQRLIPLSNLADIRYSLQDKTSYSRYNGRENISISIQKQAEANTVKVSESVKAALNELKSSLPTNFKTEVIYDEATYIRDALSNMRDNIIIGGLLAFCVLFFFLGNIRDSLFAGLAIPIAMLTTLIMMYIGGFSVNMLTLAGIALAVGSMSDCSICMSENITRHSNVLKKPLLNAAIEGTDEMVASMLSSTLTNVAVFLPLLFVTGMAQQLFRGLFIVTIFTNFASLFVSLTLIPRMAAYEWTIPGLKDRPQWLDRFMLTEEKLKKLYVLYARALRYVIANTKTVVLAVLLLFALSFFTIQWLIPYVFMPKMDQGQFLINLSMPIGTRLEVTNNVATKLETALSNINGVDVVVNVGSAQEEEDLDALQTHQAQLVATLNRKAKLSTPKVIERFKKLIRNENLEGGHVTYLLQDSPLQTALAGGAPVEVEIKGPDLAVLKNISSDLQQKFEAAPYLYGVSSSFALPSRETQVVVDKDRAASFQLSVADIARTALIAIKGVVATKFKEGGKETDIRVRLRGQDRESSSSIRQLALRSPKGLMVTLEGVAQVNPGLGASEIRHLDQQRAVVVSAQISGDSDDSLKKVEKMIGSYRNMKDYSVELGGESRRRNESFSSLKYTFLLAIILVYMIMAAQFESLTQPLIIMVTVPFSIIGVALTLFVTGIPFSSVAVLGVVILAGIVVNNGIVLIDHMNNLVAEGMNLKEAIVTASINRLRPILMTSFTAILGVLPLTLGIGKGDELAQPLAVVTFGGMFVSTLLTLLVIPLAYHELTKWESGRKLGLPLGAIPGKALVFLLLTPLLFSSCTSTYKRENLKQDITNLAKKEYKLDVEVQESGDTIGVQFGVPNLIDELVSSSKEIDDLLMVLSRTALSCDRPPKFLVLDVRDMRNPKLHLVFTQYVIDIHKLMSENISRSQYLDRTLIELVVGKQRTAFDAEEMDIIRLMMMATEASSDTRPDLGFNLAEVKLPEFLSKVTANTLKRILRESKPFKSEYVLRQVASTFQPQGQFKVLLDLAAKPSVQQVPHYLESKVLPKLAAEVSDLFKSYKFEQFSQITIIEKNSGKLLIVPKP